MDATSNRLVIDFNDGDSAIERTTGAIAMILQEATEELVSLGYDRSYDMISIAMTSGSNPYGLSMRGRPVFRVVFMVTEDGRLSCSGNWMNGERPRKRGWLRRLFSFRYRGSNA